MLTTGATNATCDSPTPCIVRWELSSASGHNIIFNPSASRNTSEEAHGRCHSSLHCFECDTLSLSLLPHCMQTLMILAEVSATAGSKLASPQAKQSLGRCTKAILLQTTPARPWIVSNFVQTIAKTVPSLVGIGLSLLLICPPHVLFGASLACCNLALSAVLFWVFFCQGSLERLSRRCPKRPHPKQLRRQN